MARNGPLLLLKDDGSYVGNFEYVMFAGGWPSATDNNMQLDNIHDLVLMRLPRSS